MGRRLIRFAFVCVVILLFCDTVPAQEAVQPKFSNPFRGNSDESGPAELDGSGTPAHPLRQRLDEPEKLVILPEVKKGSANDRIVEAFTGVAKELLQENASDDRLRKLKKERCQVVLREVEARMYAFRRGHSDVKEVLRACERLSHSMLALDPGKPTRVALLKQNVELAKQIEKFSTINMQNGIGTLQDVMRAKYDRLSYEILLEEAIAGEG